MTRHFTLALAAAAAGITLTASALGSTAGAAQAGSPPLASFTASGRLLAVAATSARNAWAVGLDGAQNLIVHWNGRAWKRVRNSRGGFLLGVTATSARNAWAVGGTDWFRPQTVIEHWNGKTWKRVRSPSPGPNSMLSAVAATSPRNAWAVGSIGPGPGINPGRGTRTLIEHWNGRTWKRVPSPSPGPAAQLIGVTATSPCNAWAVGWTGTGYQPGASSQTLIEHWNGRTWKRVPSPSPGPVNNLPGVTATSARNAWAVGVTSTHLNINDKTLILHWNGRAWKRVASPTPAPHAFLSGVGATSRRNAWAVGMTIGHNTCAPRCATVIEHWNGHAWKQVPSPNRPSGDLNQLFGVAPTSRHNAWAVGTTDYASTLIVRWNGHAWK